MLVFPFFGGSKRKPKRPTENPAECEEGGCSVLSVIVPAYNEEANIRGALKSAQGSKQDECRPEVIVVDGGSTDRTREIAKSMGARVVEAPKGRASQMNAGARIASGDVLLFLHSDCVLPSGYQSLVFKALRPTDRESQAPPQTASVSPEPQSPPSESGTEPPSPPGWGAFARIKLDGPGRGLRSIEKGIEMRTRWKHLPYGDQGIFVHRRLFEEVGGYRDIPLMEDYQLVCDLKKHSAPRLVDAPITASARRWEKKGLVETTVTNQFIIMAYKLGVPPSRLAEWYRKDTKQF